MLATRADTDTAIQTCVFTACADVPKKRVLRRGCVIHGKKFDRPAQTRPLAHRRCGPRQMMGQDRQASARGIAIASAAPPCGIAWLGGEHRQLDVLIAEHSGAAIDRAGVPAGAREGGRGAGDEDTAA